MIALPPNNILSALPSLVHKHLHELSGNLQTLLGNNLVSLVVHGSLARGEYRAGHSDVDVLVVLEDISPQLVSQLANPLKLARDAARIESLLLLRGEMARSHDVFPLFYDEIKECHLLLAGQHPFEGRQISDAHRRLRIEQELREINTRLRRLGVDALGKNAFFAEALEHKLRQLRFVLLALLRRRGVGVADSKLATVLEAACTRWPTPLAPLMNVAADPVATFEALFALLRQTIDDVDQEPS